MAKEQLAPRIKKDKIIISNLWKTEDKKESIPQDAIPLCNGFFCKQIDTGICKKANVCLDCPMFIPSMQFISSYMIQLQEIEATIAIAKTCGYTKMLQNCIETKKSLEDIIKRLETKKMNRNICGLIKRNADLSAKKEADLKDALNKLRKTGDDFSITEVCKGAALVDNIYISILIY